MESAAKGMKHSINNIDEDIMMPLLEKLWFNNMLYDDNMSIKGDINIVAKGSAVMIAKDIAQQRRNELLQTTNNPTDLQIMGIDGRAKVLREFVKAADMPDGIVPDDKEMVEKIKQASQQPNMEQLKLEQKSNQVAIDASLRDKEIQTDERVKNKEIDTDAQISREEMESREAIAEDRGDVDLIRAAQQEREKNKDRKEKRSNAKS
ncbi:MAG TPA: hypothetical protein EYQ00_00900 [Dehalococcoidia bacterium]|nr:hypothetical protein [Dehalococcoidia bacterium]